MSKRRVVVQQVLSGNLSVTAAAKRYGFSRQHVQRLLRLYRDLGVDGLTERSRRPKSNALSISEAVRARIIELRCVLSDQGLDAGPVTLAWHLEREGLKPPSTSTIRRVLRAAGLVAEQPQKRPKSSFLRFEAAQPNECWQSDFTHWQVADGGTVEIIAWLDDHSRYLLACRAFRRVGGGDVLATFTACIEAHGAPAATLTDNAGVYTSRFVGGKNAFEHLLAQLGIRQKNGHPGHPTTQGKVERFHQTLKKRLRSLRPAATLEELQTQLDAFRQHYNERRPHRALAGNATPGDTYRATPKAGPSTPADAVHYRIRRDRVDKLGNLTLRHAGKLHHLGVGARHKHQRVTILVDHTTATVIQHDTGEILSRHHIDPSKDYWRNQDRSPGRWPGPKKSGTQAT